MATGFRRSRARRGGRAIAAFAIVAMAGQAGLATAPFGLTRTSHSAPVAIVASDTLARTNAAPETSVDRGAAAHFAAFNESTTAPPSESTADDPSGATGGLQPSIQYEEAERHAADKIPFTPGDRVTVGFAPSAGDTWTIGGGKPMALPAGRLDGKAIRGQGAANGKDHSAPDPGGKPVVGDPPTGSALEPTADPTTEPSVDLPAGGSPTAATNASFRDPTGAGPSTPTVEPDAVISPNGLRREIFGFLPYWEVGSSSLRLDYAKISTIAYFGVGADAAGNLQTRNPDGSTTVGWSGWTSAAMSSIISTAHARHTRVVLTVQSFGWSTSGLDRQKQLLGSSTRRLNLARQIAAAVRDRGADGVNLDFEPLAPTYDAEFTALVRTIRAELNRIHSGYQITFDATGSIGNYPIADATAPGGADAIFIMGYDYRTASSSPVGSVAPLGRTGYDIRDTVAAYTARVAPSKLILGVPYYGRAWSTSSDALRATNTSGTQTGASTTVVYDTAADYLAQYGRRYDAAEGVAWTAYQRENCTATYGCVTSWRQLYVDDAAAISAKYDLVNSYGLRGAGIWALGYDGTRPELWAAIQRRFVTDTTPPTTGVLTLPASEPNPGFTVAWAGRDDVAVGSYDVQVSVDGRSWASWQTATKASTATWYGIDGHTYAFRVRARDPRGNLSAWNVATTSAAAGSSLAAGTFGRVRLEGLPIRSAPGTGSPKIGEFDSGDIVAILSGPTSVDGYTWFKVTGPLAEWGAVSAVRPAAWIATSGGRVSPAKAPNATRIDAVLGDLTFGDAGSASVGAAASASAQRAFSPNGDGSRDTLALDWRNDRALDALSLRVFRADGSVVGDVRLGQLAAGASSAAWNGKVGATALPNGRYLVSLVGSAAGGSFFNPALSFRASALATYGVTIDTVAPIVTAAGASGTLMSPNGDGILDTIRVSIGSTGADRWAFSAAPVAGTTVGRAITSGSGSGTGGVVTWTGRNSAGALVADGTYRLTLTVLDHAGNRAARAWTVRVDRTPAAIQASAAPGSFSPNNDGASDTARLAWSASERITGVARIYRGTTVIRSWAVGGVTSGAVTWNGTTASGAAAPDGTYLFQVAGRDAAGNLAVRRIAVVLDRTLTTLRWNGSAFYPQDGDKIAPSARLTFSLKRAAAVDVGIYAGSTLVRTVWANRSLSAGAYTWTWDGKGANGAIVARGSYTVRVVARSSVGTSVLTRGILADAFNISVSATTVRAGQALTVTVVSSEGLRAAPAITFAQPGRSAVTRTATSLGSGRYRVTFTVATGATGTATIAVAGRDTAGGLNTSSRSVTIR